VHDASPVGRSATFSTNDILTLPLRLLVWNGVVPDFLRDATNVACSISHRSLCFVDPGRATLVVSAWRNRKSQVSTEAALNKIPEVRGMTP